MKSFSDHLKKLPAERQARIEANAQRKIAVIRLQQVREQAGITQQELAERLNMSQPALSRFEHRPNITMTVLQRYIEAIGGKLEINVVLPKTKTRNACRIGSARTNARRISLTTV